MADGKYFFSKEEALTNLGLNPNQFRLQAFRLYQKKSLKNLGHGFFMIVPPEYHHFGSLPPHWIVDPYMKYLKHDYYIGLLSAASLYGTTQQQPMTFQVLTDKPMRPIKLERGGIEFHCYKDCLHRLGTNNCRANWSNNGYYQGNIGFLVGRTQAKLF